MSNSHISGSDNSAASNSNLSASRREIRNGNMTGALPPLSPGGLERGRTGSSDFEQLIESLHELFEHDRQIASQQDATRCGLCYLHFPLTELFYREEGFYICSNCDKSLGKHSQTMVRRQQKL
ncbi:MAG TPA: hypothetical protein VL485_10825 [Ktedonobacteraceae bacterium]|nr:hypothetical protein [Ktedonobacteraceae bacterium]